MTEDVDALVRELKGLRRGQGRTLPKLQAARRLRAALGDPPNGALVETFDFALRALGGDLKSVALRNAMGLGLADPQDLTMRRQAFGARAEVSRAPDTIAAWEDEKLEELAQRLFAGNAAEAVPRWLVAVVVRKRRIEVVAEGAQRPGQVSRTLYNPNRHASLPCFIYRLPTGVRPERLTLCLLFADRSPRDVHAVASEDIFAILIQDQRQDLEIAAGGIDGIDAQSHTAVHYDQPRPEVYFSLAWT